MCVGLVFATYQVIYNPYHDLKFQFMQTSNFSGNNITANWFFGKFNWFIKSGLSTGYLKFNGTHLSQNETKINRTIIANAPALYYKILSKWQNISGRPTHLSNLTDDIVYSTKNVSSSNFWDGNNVPSDLNNRITLSQVNITDEDWLEETTAASRYVNRTLWTTIDNYPSACAANNWVTTIGDTLTCTQPSAASITAGTFGSGNYVMDQNLTVQGLVLEKDTGHVIFNNATCIIIRGDTSTLYVC